MNIKRFVVFWGLIWILLTLLFSTTLESIIVAFYFVSFLMPVGMATSFFFNYYLVPRCLITGRRWRFVQYFSYMLIVSIYLELLVMILAFVILADYQISNLGKIAGDIYLLTVVLYLIVFIEGVVLTSNKLKEKSIEVHKMKRKLEKETLESITLKVDRRNKIILLSAICYIESLSDYVKVYTTSEIVITKEKISSLEAKLPSGFIRVHRSFIVNRQYVDTHTRDKLFICDQEISIGRKYKSQAIEKLSASIV